MKKKMKVLVTAGATTVPIDQVRAITNIFKGRTGTKIAEHFYESGYNVVLLTSNPDLVQKKTDLPVIRYRTYDDLYSAMQKEVTTGNYDIIIHSAAVSDYYVNGVFFQDKKGKLQVVDNTKKMSSEHKELFLRLAPTEKIIDKIRKEWGFKGYLVKFKLQVGITDNELRAIADKSRIDSQADMIVANCLEWSNYRAEIRTEKSVIPVKRAYLPRAIREEIES